MCKVTVIMPSLNVVKYIGKCIRSVINQTIKEIEILIIDAGSTDGTKTIIQSYAGRDSRIRYIHSDKKSYGYQINLGLSIAQGEYVGIVETDDWIEPDTYEVLYQYAKEYAVDYVRGVAECYKEIESGMSYGWPINILPKKSYDDTGVIRLNPQSQREILVTDSFLWNGIYKRDFLLGVALNETTGAAYQDIGFLTQVYYKATNALYIDKLVYHYRKDNADCSCYSRNAFRYFWEEYQFVHRYTIHYDERWRLYSDVKFFHQIYVRFKLMAESDSYWEEARPYIKEIHGYFCGKQDIIQFLGAVQKEAFIIFIESPTKLFEYLRKGYVENQDIWKAFLHKFENRQIVIFGSGRRGYFLQFLFTKKKIGHILGYCDNDFDKIGRDISGLMVKSLDYWIKMSDNICYAVTPTAYSDEIEKQLLAKGVLAKNIEFFELPRDYSIL